MARGVGVLRLHGRVQRLDRFERALLEPAIGVTEGDGALAQRVRLTTKSARRAAGEHDEKGPKKEEDRADRDPELPPAIRDRSLERRGVGVDLVGADHLVGTREHRRVHLEEALDRELRLDRVLGVSQILEPALRLAGLDDSLQVVAERETLA